MRLYCDTASAMVRVMAAQLPAIEAEAQRTHVQALAVAFGSMDAETSRQIQEGWARTASGADRGPKRNVDPTLALAEHGIPARRVKWEPPVQG